MYFNTCGHGPDFPTMRMAPLRMSKNSEQNLAAFPTFPNFASRGRIANARNSVFSLLPALKHADGNQIC